MKICEICGKEFDKSKWGYPYEYICSDECFDYRFWSDIIKNKNKHIIIDGRCFILGKDKNPSKYCGFGGKIFKLKMNNGTTIETNNLWFNGFIPEKFRSELKDNAVFIEGGF